VKLVCPPGRSTRVRVGPDGTLARCLACLYSWVVSTA
jgi:hypothetical protein